MAAHEALQVGTREEKMPATFPVAPGILGLQDVCGFPRAGLISPQRSVPLPEALCCHEVATRGWQTIVAKTWTHT